MNIDNIKKKAYRLSKEEKQQIIERLNEFMKNRKEIVFAYAYGSFVEDIPFHDIDVGVYVSNIREESATFYALELAHILSNALRIRVDVYVLNFAPVLFLYHVIKGHLIFERDEDIRVRIVENTIREYLDLKPILHRSIKEAFAA